MKNIAILLAAGRGTRFGGMMPKQFSSLLGKPVFIYSALVFDNHPDVDRFYIVADKDFFPFIRKAEKKYGLKKLAGLIQGGETRTQSSLAALSALEPAEKERAEAENIIFHDAARPLINREILSDCIRKLDSFQAVSAAVPSTDTIFEAAADGTVSGCPDRSSLMLIQTPQGFRRNIIEKAYAQALASTKENIDSVPSYGTDDCSVVFKFLPNTKIAFSEGANFNIKLTYREDIFLAEKFLQINKRKSKIQVKQEKE